MPNNEMRSKKPKSSPNNARSFAHRKKKRTIDKERGKKGVQGPSPKKEDVMSIVMSIVQFVHLVFQGCNTLNSLSSTSS